MIPPEELSVDITTSWFGSQDRPDAGTDERDSETTEATLAYPYALCEEPRLKSEWNDDHAVTGHANAGIYWG